VRRAAEFRRLNAVLDPAPARERAEAAAKEHGLRACTVAELLADRDIEIVINQTVPKAHTEVDLAVLAASLAAATVFALVIRSRLAMVFLTVFSVG